MLEPTEVRDLFQRIYCELNESIVKQTYGHEPDEPIDQCRMGYIRGKVERAMNNPLSWYCELDNNHAKRFLNLIYKN